MTIPTQAQIEAAAKQLYVQNDGNPDDWENLADDYKLGCRLDAKAALAAAAEVGPDRAQEFYEAWVKTRDALERLSAEHKQLRTATVERCAQYHDNAARECEEIAAVNMDNDLGHDCITRAQDHRIDAAAIRALKNEP